MYLLMHCENSYSNHNPNDTPQWTVSAALRLQPAGNLDVSVIEGAVLKRTEFLRGCPA